MECMVVALSLRKPKPKKNQKLNKISFIGVHYSGVNCGHVVRIDRLSLHRGNCVVFVRCFKPRLIKRFQTVIFSENR